MGCFVQLFALATHPHTLRHHNIHTTEKHLAEDMLKAQNSDPLWKFTGLTGRYLEERKWRVHLKFPKFNNSTN